MHLAACLNLHALVESAVHNNLPVDLNARAADNATAAHWAAFWGNPAFLQMLAKNNADARLQDANGCTPLHIAATMGKMASIEMLLKWPCEHRPELDLADKIEQTPLRLAIANNHRLIVWRLLESGAKIDKVDKGRTPLYTAVARNHKSIVWLLLEKGADPNAAESELGLTPLHVAVQRNCVSTVILLLDHGGDALRSDKRQWTALHLAAQQDLGVVVERLILSVSRDSPLMNMIDVWGCTALHQAAARGHLNMTMLLIRYGADIRIRDSLGNSPRDFARRGNHVAVEQYLSGLESFVC